MVQRIGYVCWRHLSSFSCSDSDTSDGAWPYRFVHMDLFGAERNYRKEAIYLTETRRESSGVGGGGGGVWGGGWRVGVGGRGRECVRYPYMSAPYHVYMSAVIGLFYLHWECKHSRSFFG